MSSDSKKVVIETVNPETWAGVTVRNHICPTCRSNKEVMAMYRNVDMASINLDKENWEFLLCAECGTSWGGDKYYKN